MPKLREYSADNTLYKAVTALQFLLKHWQHVCVFQKFLQLLILLFLFSRTNIISLHFTKMGKWKENPRYFVVASVSTFTSLVKWNFFFFFEGVLLGIPL